MKMHSKMIQIVLILIVSNNMHVEEYVHKMVIVLNSVLKALATFNKILFTNLFNISSKIDYLEAIDKVCIIFIFYN